MSVIPRRLILHFPFCLSLLLLPADCPVLGLYWLSQSGDPVAGQTIVQYKSVRMLVTSPMWRGMGRNRDVLLSCKQRKPLETQPRTISKRRATVPWEMHFMFTYFTQHHVNNAFSFYHHAVVLSFNFFKSIGQESFKV